jgi:hypothetical protein
MPGGVALSGVVKTQQLKSLRSRFPVLRVVAVYVRMPFEWES